VGGVWGPADDEPWNSLCRSTFKGFEGDGVGAAVAGIAVPFGGRSKDGLEPDIIDGLRFMWLEAGTVPIDLTSGFTNGEGKGRCSTVPNATIEPCERESASILRVDNVRFTLFCGSDCTSRNGDAIFYGNTLAKGTEFSRVICAGQRSGVTGSRGLRMGRTDETFGGGPFAQDGSWVGIFSAEAVEGLLISNGRPAGLPTEAARLADLAKHPSLDNLSPVLGIAKLPMEKAVALLKLPIPKPTER
jgi:hypothetical protein